MTSFVHRFLPAPSSSDAAPTVLALHGTGGTENDLIPLAQSLWPTASVLAVRGRISENGAARFFRRIAEGVFDLENLHAETQSLADFVAHCAANYGFDPKNVWALGYSNGANIAASLLLSRPETLKGAILLRAMTPFQPQQMPDLAEKSIFLAAGRFDPLVPLPNIENLAALFRNAGADVTLRLENASHGLIGHEIDEARHFLAEKLTS